MKKQNTNIIINLAVILVCAVLVTTSIIKSAEADVEVYETTDGNTILRMDEQLPEELAERIREVDIVLYVITDWQGTEIMLSGQYTEEEIVQYKDYLESIEYTVEKNRRSTVTFPGYTIPECHYDHYTNKAIAIYWYNGQPVHYPQDDYKCE